MKSNHKTRIPRMEFMPTAPKKLNIFNSDLKNIFCNFLDQIFFWKYLETAFQNCLNKNSKKKIIQTPWELFGFQNLIVSWGSPKMAKIYSFGNINGWKYLCRMPRFDVRFSSSNIKEVTVSAPLTTGAAKMVKIFKIPVRNA